MKNKIWLIVKFLLMIISVGFSVYFIKVINDLNILPNKYLIIGSIVILIINLLIIINLLLKKIIFNIFGFILSIIIIGVSIFGIIHISNVSNFIDKTFSGEEKEVTKYNVVVLKNSNYEKLEDLDNLSIGYIVLDEYSDECNNTLKSKVNLNLKSYDDPYTLYKDFKKNKIDSIVISDGFYDLLNEDNKDFEESIKVIYTFEIENKLEMTEEDIKELKPINVLISGSDARSDKIYAKTRSDVNMIMTIDPANHKILLTSIPRDYYVQLHGTKGNKDKLTHAGIYGVEKTKTTLEDLFDIKIDYTIKIGFKSVVQVVDTIGGVDIYSDKSFVSHCVDNWAERTNVKEGMNHFTGAQALSYARERHAYTTGDHHRVQNQQQVLEAIIDKVFSDKSLLKDYDKVLSSFSELYRTDIPSDYIKLVVKEQLTNMSSWTIEKQQVSGSGAMLQTYSMPGVKLWVMIPDMNTVLDARNKIISFTN